jgi:uncharacterized membrane protein
MSEAQVLTRLEHASALDPANDRLRRVVEAVIRPRRLRDALHGVWLGHPLHPAMVQVPVGAWLATAVLDALPGTRRAATVLVGVGTASALPTALAGLNDWSTLAREQQRVGLVHAASNTIAVSLYTGSFLARLAGRHGAGRTLAYLGMSAAGIGAYLGGHLSYGQAAGVNHSIADLRHIPDGWHPLARFAELPEGATTVRRIGDVPVLIFRRGDAVTVLLERCAHQSGPLGAGKLVHEDEDACVVCQV